MSLGDAYSDCLIRRVGGVLGIAACLTRPDLPRLVRAMSREE
ncbi:hypothetical protein [Nocardia abscessus]|nr:hypothetical protein [Nocardia abscessus]